MSYQKPKFATFLEEIGKITLTNAREICVYLTFYKCLDEFFKYAKGPHYLVSFSITDQY